MSYVAYVVEPDCIQRFLYRGRLVDDFQNATQHPHPSNAQRAADSYRAKHPRSIVGYMDLNADYAPIS